MSDIIFTERPIVIIESPYMGSDTSSTRQNIRYARACIADSLKRGEAPFASHLIYTQPGVLDDNTTKERILGIDAGHIFLNMADYVAVYTDLGISGGMKLGIARTIEKGKEIKERFLGSDWENEYLARALKHSHRDLWGV